MKSRADIIAKRVERNSRRIDNVAFQASAKALQSGQEGVKSAISGPKKRKKAPSLSKLKKMLWEEMRHVVYAQSPICLTCGDDGEPQACHIAPSDKGAATRFFLPNIYRGCADCNANEKWNRGKWAILTFPGIFGEDFVRALYAFSQTTFQLKRGWLLEQIERMKKLRAESQK